MTASQIHELARSLVLLSGLGGMLGALLLLAVLSVFRWLADRVEGSAWWLDRMDRSYVRSLNGSQRGRIGLGLLFWLSVVLIASLAACAAPAPYGDAHGVWLERVKSAGW